MKKTIGILAHVDAGKTTLCEQILYHSGAIASCGRVDHQNTFLDTNDIERSRGITIFSGLAHFLYHENEYFLIDTPGHIDFAGETERALSVLDYAVLVLNAAAGVEAHTKTLFQLLQKYNIPVFFFLNKTDLIQADIAACMQSIYEKCSPSAFYLSSPDMLSAPDNTFLETLAEYDDELLSLYLEDALTPESMEIIIKKRIRECRLFPCMSGSALNNQGVSEFLEIFDRLTPTFYDEKKEKPLLARAYKIQHDKNGGRITFLKLLSGSIIPKKTVTYTTQSCMLQEAFSSEKKLDFDKDFSLEEKINQLRLYHGDSFSSVSSACAGDIIAVTGLSSVPCAELSSLSLHPALKATVLVKDSTPLSKVRDCLLKLEAEDPLLKVSYHPSLQELNMEIMGKIQLEVLKQYLSERFSLAVDFAPPEVLYQETLASPTDGCGHFEPLRHYAEVHFHMEPAPRGSGISFTSCCHVDLLPLHFQRLIETHVFEKEHKGVLIGAALCDVKITLTKGRFHIKHTEGGDFREAVYRAVRQGLYHAENILLEPYYAIDIYAPLSYMGRILSDIRRLNGSFDNPEQSGDTVHITGRAPVICFLNYPAEFTALTKGEGTITLKVDGYARCHNPEEVITAKAYNRDADLENPGSSVFCHKGEAFLVKAEDAQSFMHCQ